MPVGSFNGAFANTPAHDLGTVAIKAALNRAKVAAEEVDEVILAPPPHLDAWRGPTNPHGP
jgi:acetyl-CoA acetyltransferase